MLYKAIEKAVALEKEGEEDQALDLLWDVLDDELHKKDYGPIDTLLIDIDPDACTPYVLLGVLTITLPASHLLPGRTGLFSRIRDSFRGQGIDLAELEGLGGPDVSDVIIFFPWKNLLDSGYSFYVQPEGLLEVRGVPHTVLQRGVSSRGMAHTPMQGAPHPL